MTFKIPKSITICGKAYSIKVSGVGDGGVTDLSKKTITIGQAPPEEMRETFFHEVFEAILFERGHRYTCYAEGNDNIRFVLCHQEFENFVKDICATLPNVLKK